MHVSTWQQTISELSVLDNREIEYRVNNPAKTKIPVTLKTRQKQKHSTFISWSVDVNGPRHNPSQIKIDLVGFAV